MLCANCRSENEPGRKFCGECGQPLALVCASCRTPNTPGLKFCGECGAPLTPEPRPQLTGAATDPTAPRAEQLTERRHVSVLFADLVGFTTLSEARDPEEVRGLPFRYFEVCRRLVV